MAIITELMDRDEIHINVRRVVVIDDGWDCHVERASIQIKDGKLFVSNGLGKTMTQIELPFEVEEE